MGERGDERRRNIRKEKRKYWCAKRKKGRKEGTTEKEKK
jgi:hypothetical protein